MVPETVLFGGTFDPVHNAHLEIARAALTCPGARRIVFVPAANPPHKSEGAQAPYQERVRMTELACADEPAFEVSTVEHGTARSYSILTIEKLSAGRAQRLGFLIGADAFAEIESWYRWRDVVRSVEFIVVARPGAEYRIPNGAVVHRLRGINLDVSSSAIRNRLAQGDLTVPLPAPVLAYIRSRGLYGSQPA